jgi:F0F1-type ATP synthase membrane subunit b/b'
MKIEQSKVRVDMPKEKPAAGGLLKVEPPQAPGKPKRAESLPDLSIDDVPPKPKKAAPAAAPIPASISMPASPLRDDYSTLREAALSVERIRAAAQQELEQIRKMRADAIRYQQETATKARSEANQLILHARLATQREIEELIRKASEEIQKMLADIRVIRITAQEELSAQRKFTDAAKLNSLSFSFKEQMARTCVEKPVTKPRRQPATTR